MAPTSPWRSRVRIRSTSGTRATRCTRSSCSCCDTRQWRGTTTIRPSCSSSPPSRWRPTTRPSRTWRASIPSAGTCVSVRRTVVGQSTFPGWRGGSRTRPGSQLLGQRSSWRRRTTTGTGAKRCGVRPSASWPAGSGRVQCSRSPRGSWRRVQRRRGAGPRRSVPGITGKGARRSSSRASSCTHHRRHSVRPSSPTRMEVPTRRRTRRTVSSRLAMASRFASSSRTASGTHVVRHAPAGRAHVCQKCLQPHRAAGCTKEV